MRPLIVEIDLYDDQNECEKEPVEFFLKRWIFSVCNSQLGGRILFAPPNMRVFLLHNDLLGNGTCSVTGGRISYSVGTNGNKPKGNLKAIKINSSELKSLKRFSYRSWWSNWGISLSGRTATKGKKNLEENLKKIAKIC